MRISYDNSVRLSVCRFRPGTNSSPGEIEYLFLLYDCLESLVFRDKISRCWIKGAPTNEGWEAPP